MLADTDSSRIKIAFFLFPLLASVVLLYCFACLCPKRVYIVCESRRQVIMIKESRSKRKSKPKTRPSSGKKTKSSCFCREPHFLCLGYDQSPSSVLISKATPFETKINELFYRFWQRDCTCTCSNIHGLVKPSLISLETVAEKILIPCSHAKKIRIRNLRFRKIHFRERFRKAPFWGPSVFKRFRIRADPDTCV